MSMSYLSPSDSTSKAKADFLPSLMDTKQDASMANGWFGEWLHPHSEDDEGSASTALTWSVCVKRISRTALGATLRRSFGSLFRSPRNTSKDAHTSLEAEVWDPGPSHLVLFRNKIRKPIVTTYPCWIYHEAFDRNLCLSEINVDAAAIVATETSFHTTPDFTWLTLEL